MSGAHRLRVPARTPIVLDMMLPNFDGLEVIPRLWADYPWVGVLFSHRSRLGRGAYRRDPGRRADYVAKPFSLNEVLASLGGIRRRARMSHRDEYQAGLRRPDDGLGSPRREPGGGIVELNPATALEVARFLMRNRRQVLSMAQLLDQVWNYDFGSQAHVVELLICHLRKKVAAVREPLIQTLCGVGRVLKTRT